MRFVSTLAALLVVIAGCEGSAPINAMDATVDGRVDVPWGASDAGSDAADAADVSTRFPCPEGWVASEHGGCGPAVLLCAPDGGAAEGACVGNDPTSPTTVRDPDGVEGTRFYRLPDGGIGGAWSTPWVCPAGWTNAPEGHCRPTLRDDCPRYSGPLPDGTCTPTDESRCPPGGFPELPPEAAGQRVVYVRQMATLTPDGSMRAPYPDLNQAVAAEPEAEWFLLYPGYYPVGFTVRHPMHILGGCAASVQLTGTMETPLFRADGPTIRLDLRGVSLTRGRQLVVAQNRAEVSVQRCILSLAEADTITVVSAASVEIVDSLLLDPGPTSNGALVAVDTRGVVSLRRSALQGRAHRAVSVGPDGIVRLDSVSLRGARSDTVSVDSGGQIEIRRATIRGETTMAVTLSNRSHAEIEDLAVRDTSVVAIDGVRNGAIGVREGCSLVGRRISVENASGYGLSVLGRETTATVDQMFVRSVRGYPGGFGGSGVVVEQFSRASLRRAQIFDTADIGLNVAMFGALDVRDTLVHRVVPQGNGLFGIGMAVTLLGSIDARRVLIEQASMMGIGAVGLPERVTRLVDLNAVAGRTVDPRARIALEDVIVRDARPLERYPAAGIITGVAGFITGRRVSVDQQPGLGIAIGDFGFETDALLAGGMRSGLLRADQAPALRVLLGPTLDGPSTATLDGVFVRGIRRWRIGYEPSTPDRPLDDLGAYSFYTGPRCTFTATDVTLDGTPSAEIGLASLGATTLRRGVIARHSGCAATLNNTNGSAAITLDSITLSGNRRDATCADDALPAVRLPLSPN